MKYFIIMLPVIENTKVLKYTKDLNGKFRMGE